MRFSLLQVSKDAHAARPSEDQQRINTFSKLNTRLRSIEEKIEVLKVRGSDSFIHSVPNPLSVCLQAEKEALDDISMELELADGDQPVMCVLQPYIALDVRVPILPLPTGTGLAKRSSTCPIHEPSNG